MPIIEMEIVLKPREQLVSGLALTVANAAGETLGFPEGQTWVKVRILGPASYAESGGGPPEGVCPIFVSVLQADDLAGEKRREQADMLSSVIAHICGREKEHVHILFLPPARGRIAFGGTLLS